MKWREVNLSLKRGFEVKIEVILEKNARSRGSLENNLKPSERAYYNVKIISNII